MRSLLYFFSSEYGRGCYKCIYTKPNNQQQTIMSKKQKAYILLKLYQEYSEMDYNTSRDLWYRLLEMDDFDLDSKIEEDKELIIELFPELQEKIEELA